MNVTGSESGGVILNYVRASDTWVVNVSADGLQPGVSYEVIFNVPGIISIGCFIANAGGHGHLNVSNIVLPYASFIFPPAGPESRINVRLDDPITAGCNGILGTGVLTTLTGFGGSGLIATGSNRGH